MAAGAHKASEYLAKNAFGQVPVIEDGEITLADSNAILVYLASRYDDSGSWLPRDPVGAAEVQRWFSVAAGQLRYGAAMARFIRQRGGPYDLKTAQALATHLLGLMEQHLEGRTFLLTSERPTVADIAMYTYTVLVPEAGLSLEGCPRVRAWLGRIEALPGFVPMTRWSEPKG